MSRPPLVINSLWVWECDSHMTKFYCYKETVLVNAFLPRIKPPNTTCLHDRRKYEKFFYISFSYIKNDLTVLYNKENSTLIFDDLRSLAGKNERKRTRNRNRIRAKICIIFFLLR